MRRDSVVILGNVPEVSGCNYTELRQTKSIQIDSNKGPEQSIQSRRARAMWKLEASCARTVR